MNLIRSLLHSVALHNRRFIASKSNLVLKELTSERINDLRKIMEIKGNKFDANRKLLPKSKDFQTLSPPDPDFLVTKESLQEQDAINEFIKKVFESAEKTKKRNF